MNLTDTHCHLNLEHFDADRPDVLARARARGVTHILVPALTVADSRQILSLAQNETMLYAAVGIHPTEAKTWTADSLESLRALCGAPKVVAIGEIGLDYYWDAAPPALQKDILKRQIDLAAEQGLPVVLHSRDKDNALDGPCIDDLLHILTDWVAALRRAGNPLAENPGVLHSFSSSLQRAQQAINLGFYLGVTGPVTFRNAIKRQEIIAALPLERLLIETDAPFLAPHPHRGKRNEPAFVALIAGKIAALHHISVEAAAAQTSANAAKLFAWRT